MGNVIFAIPNCMYIDLSKKANLFRKPLHSPSFIEFPISGDAVLLSGTSHGKRVSVCSKACAEFNW